MLLHIPTENLLLIYYLAHTVSAIFIAIFIVIVILLLKGMILGVGFIVIEMIFG